jgi:hypothetical protein
MQLDLFSAKPNYRLRKWWSWSRIRGDLFAAIEYPVEAQDDDEALNRAPIVCRTINTGRDEFMFYLFRSDVAISRYSVRDGRVTVIKQ